MKLFGIEITKATKKQLSAISSIRTGLPLRSRARSNPMLLSAVYRCVDLISDSVGAVPMKVYHIDRQGFKKEASWHPANDVLKLEPNENMTAFTFFKTLVTSVLLTGNGYAYIERGKDGEVQQLIYMPSQNVKVVFMKDDEGIERKRYQLVGFGSLIEPKEMIHVLNFSYNGIEGVSTLEHARQTIDMAAATEEHASGFFKSGASVNGVLKVEGVRLTKEQKEQIYNTWQNHYDATKGDASGIAILEGNMTYQPISVSPRDSQFLESREFSVVDICRFFSVSPVKAFDLSKSSYSTVEATQLQYLTDTLLSVLTKIELEINRKVFTLTERPQFIAEFDTSVLLRTDKAALSSYYRTMFNVGAVTPNEVRKYMNLTRKEGGDKAFVPVNLQPL